MRSRLAGLVAATMSLVLLAFLVPIGVLLWREAEQRAISGATLEVQRLGPLVAINEDAIAGGLESLDEDGPEISIHLPDGRVLGAPAERTPSVDLAALGQAFTADTEGGVEILVPVQGLAEGTAVIRSYVPNAQLHDGVVQTVVVLAALALALFGVGLLLSDRLGRNLVGSVRALAGTADRLAEGDLTARVTPTGPPELQHVGTELNRLAGRIGELLGAVREEVADLAHRLRTPVTALRLDAESLRDADERARLGADVDDLSRTVDEVIRTALRPVREGAGAMADLAAIAASRAAFWTPLAEDTGRRFESVIPDQPVAVAVSKDDLDAMLDALLGNVFAHTPDGVSFRIEVTPRAGGGGTLLVEDGGPGLDGASRSSSTGLGLDIVRRTAEAADGQLRLGSSTLGGLRVQVDLGAAKSVVR